MKDFYLRVEFQARGAPHIHCLLWLNEEILDEETNLIISKPLTTMYSMEDEPDTQNEVIKKIEECAKNIICASISEIKCVGCKQKEKLQASGNSTKKCNN